MTSENNEEIKYLGVNSLDGTTCFLAERKSDYLKLTEEQRPCLHPLSGQIREEDTQTFLTLTEKIQSIYIIPINISSCMPFANALDAAGKLTKIIDIPPDYLTSHDDYSFNSLLRSSKIPFEILIDTLIISGLTADNFLDHMPLITTKLASIREAMIPDCLKYLKDKVKVQKDILDGLKRDIKNYRKEFSLKTIHGVMTEDDLQTMIADMNSKHAVVMVNGACRVLTEEINPASQLFTIKFSMVKDFYDFYKKDRLTILEEGKMKKPFKAPYWHSHPNSRRYQDVIFIPGREVPGYYNLWKGFAVEPIKGDCSLYLDHVYENIAQKDGNLYKYIMSWMANAVQNPAEVGHVAIVLKGKRGTGKGVFATFFGELFGSHFKQIHQTQHLTGKFNAHLKDALIVFADEVTWGGSHQDEGVLKTMITEKTVNIEFKNIDVIQAPNYRKFIIASNNDWVIPAGLDERRFLVISMNDTHAKDYIYFSAIENQMKSGGSEALLDYLLTYDTTGVNLRDAPKTEALWYMKVQTMSCFEKWWFERLWAGAQLSKSDIWDEGYIPKKTLRDEYHAFADVIGHKHKETDTMLTKLLKDFAPGLKIGREPAGERHQCYIFPSLFICRRHWEDKTECKQNWPNEGDATNLPYPTVRILPPGKTVH